MNLDPETYDSPVRWARRGRVSRLLARAWPMQSPPVLVLSTPRSGSSWVGSTLATAANAAYLYEPINQPLQTSQPRDTVRAIDRERPDAEYAALAEAAFMGWPVTSARCVRFPWQWRLRQRLGRRVVVKVVNPLAAGYFIRRFKPRVIFLVRHPAAVALSFMRPGWWTVEKNTWRGMGEWQSQTLRAAYDALEGYGAARYGLYEALCLDPIAHFRGVFAFAGLRWQGPTEAYLQQATTGGNRHDAYSTARHSQRMAYAWKAKMSAGALAALREGFGVCDLPWYRSDADWALEPASVSA